MIIIRSCQNIDQHVCMNGIGGENQGDLGIVDDGSCLGHPCKLNEENNDVVF